MKAGANDLLCSETSARTDSSSWMISYADTVTLLLCFFILFFNADVLIDKQLIQPQEQTLLSLIGVKGKSGGGRAGQAGGDAPLGGSTGVDAKLTGGSSGINLDADTFLTSIFLPGVPDNLLGQLNQLSTLEITAGEKQIDIGFPGVVFFNAGSYRLTEQGNRSVERVLQLLTQYQGMIHVTIEGYADPTPLRQDINRRFTNNIELSTFRALSVYNQFIRSGFPADSLAVSGYGDQMPPTQIIKDEATPAQIDQYRRVTFRVEAKRS